MKNKLLIIILLSIQIQAQDFYAKEWSEFAIENRVVITIAKTQIFKYKNLVFDVVWDKNLSYSGNIGKYGGIKSMKIYKDKKLINILENIEDEVALGQIYLYLYDYNLDGYLDFTLPMGCGQSCYEKYYLYNPITQKFQHVEQWDYLRIQLINKTKKQLLAVPEGTSENDYNKWYKMEGLKLKEIKY